MKEELKKTKRYWLWNIEQKTPSWGWFKTMVYLDDEFKNTNGEIYFDNIINSKKLENEYIDVEVL